MTLKDFVFEQGGVVAFAKRLGVSSSTVYVWLEGKGSPTFGMSYTIVTASKGRVSFTQLLKETTRRAKGKKK